MAEALGHGPSCRLSHKFIPKVGKRKAKKMVKLSKRDLNLSIQIETGHALLAGHVSHWADIDDTCELCLEDTETVEHLWEECPALEQWRREVHEVHKDEPEEKRRLRFFQYSTIRELLELRSKQCEDKRNLRSGGERPRCCPGDGDVDD